MTPERKCPYCDYETGIPDLMRGHHKRAHPDKPFIEPDLEHPNSPFHKHIDQISDIPNTRSGHNVVLECGHRVQTFGDLAKAGGRALCTQCRDLGSLGVCQWCGEPVLQMEAAAKLEEGTLMHRECVIRNIVGSVGHQLQRCSCHGGSFEDPPGMTKREAAKAAAQLAVELTDVRDRYEKLYEQPAEPSIN